MFSGEFPKDLDWKRADEASRQIEANAKEVPIIIGRTVLSFLNPKDMATQAGVSVRVVQAFTGEQLMRLVKDVHVPVELVPGVEQDISDTRQQAVEQVI